MRTLVRRQAAWAIERGEKLAAVWHIVRFVENYCWRRSLAAGMHFYPETGTFIHEWAPSVPQACAIFRLEPWLIALIQEHLFWRVWGFRLEAGRIGEADYDAALARYRAEWEDARIGLTRTEENP